MAAYLLLWNPDEMPHSEILRMLEARNSSPDTTVRQAWSFMSHRTAKAGDEVYLFKTTRAPKGVFGAGVLEGTAFKGPVDGDAKIKWRFNVRFYELVDPNSGFLISEDKLKTISGWSPQRGSGNMPLDEKVARELRRLLDPPEPSLTTAALADFESELRNLSDTEREAIISQRIAQSAFRKNLLKYWDGRCCIGGLTQPELLRASHIRDWSKCTTYAERLEPSNGLLLTAHLDAAFDCGLISVNENGVVHVSPFLSEEALRALGLEKPIKISGLSQKHKKNLAWHYKEKFLRK